jgi:hypothetical protein
VWADNTCDFCAEGLQASCRHGGQWGDEGVDGGQGEAVRVPQAQGTLVQVTGGWFPGTQVRKEGHIWAGGIDKDVTFAEADPTSTTPSTPPTATSTAATARTSSAAS